MKEVAPIWHLPNLRLTFVQKLCFDYSGPTKFLREHCQPIVFLLLWLIFVQQGRSKAELYKLYCLYLQFLSPSAQILVWLVSSWQHVKFKYLDVHMTE